MQVNDSAPFVASLMACISYAQANMACTQAAVQCANIGDSSEALTQLCVTACQMRCVDGDKKCLDKCAALDDIFGWAPRLSAEQGGCAGGKNVLYCGGQTASKAQCCTQTGDDPRCASGLKACDAACSSVLGARGSGLCFATSFDCGTDPDPRRAGRSIPFCPVMLSQDKSKAKLVTACNAWAQANPADYALASAQYCRDHPTRAACRCLAPRGQEWNGLKYDDMQRLMQKHQPNEFPMECVWQPCMAGTGTGQILKPAPRADGAPCPAISNFCLNMLSDVHLSDIQAGSVNIGDCVSTSQGASNDPGSVFGGANDLPFATQLRRWVSTNLVYVVAFSALLLLLLATTGWLAFRGPTAMQRAEARMTIEQLQKERAAKEALLIRNMEASKNAAVQEAGREMEGRRADSGKRVRAAFERREKQLARSIEKLEGKGGDASSSSKDALLVAAMRTKESLLKEKERSLAKLFA